MTSQRIERFFYKLRIRVVVLLCGHGDYYIPVYIGLLYTYRDLVYRSFGRCSEHLALMNIHDFRWLQAHRPSFPCCTHFCPASSAPFNNLYIYVYIRIFLIEESRYRNEARLTSTFIESLWYKYTIRIHILGYKPSLVIRKILRGLYFIVL